MTHIFVLTNHKGGVGKSTSATNLAHGILLVMEKAGVKQPRILLMSKKVKTFLPILMKTTFRVCRNLLCKLPNLPSNQIARWMRTC